MNKHPRTKSLSIRHQALVSPFPSCDPNPNITGIRKQVYGMDALLVKCGAYVYHVSEEVYNDPRCK